MKFNSECDKRLWKIYYADFKIISIGVADDIKNGHNYPPSGENIQNYASEIRRKFNLLFIRKNKSEWGLGCWVMFVFLNDPNKN